jgi:hypothetical protein
MPTLDFRNGDVLLDWFPFHGGFHVSGGALIYNGNNLHGAESVPPGQQLSLGSHNFCGSSSDPITGTGKLTFRTAAPEPRVGWGYLVPRARITSASPSRSASCSWANRKPN